MAAPAVAAPAAGVYVAGAALLAGAAWLMTPAGQRASQSFGEAVVQGGSQAVENVKDAAAAISDVFSGDKDDAQATPRVATDTNTTSRNCDGPHRGRLQVQGYSPRVDPAPIELSWPWSRPCIPPLKSEGHTAISALLMQTRAVSFESAGLRGPAFSAMSRHITSAPPIGFMAGHRRGWGVTPTGRLRRNLSAGPNAPRVDLEVHAGRAFGVR